MTKYGKSSYAKVTKQDTHIDYHTLRQFFEERRADGAVLGVSGPHGRFSLDIPVRTGRSRSRTRRLYLGEDASSVELLYQFRAKRDFPLYRAALDFIESEVIRDGPQPKLRIVK